jgi:hypothetical protein
VSSPAGEMMDTSPGSGSIILRASLIMEKAVASLRSNTKQGNQDARDWYLVTCSSELSSSIYK